MTVLKKRRRRSSWQQILQGMAKLSPNSTDLGGLVLLGAAPVPGYEWGAVAEEDVHEYMWKDIAEFLSASADEWWVA